MIHCFLPPLPGWRDRSAFIGRQGQISFYHYDFIVQALSKLSRGLDRDLRDVQAMYEQKLFSLTDLQNCFEAIAPELIRFPSLDPEPELALYARLQNERDDAYLYYNALLNRLSRFCNALEQIQKLQLPL
jgi:hypothetical protein